MTQYFKLEREEGLTSKFLGKQYYGKDYNPDSKSHSRTIGDVIDTGRDCAIKLVNAYMNSAEYSIKYTDVLYNHPERWNKQYMDKDFIEFYAKACKGHFGKDLAEALKDNSELTDLLVMGDIMNDAIKEISKMGHNLVVATYGPESQWILPSFWCWCMREQKLYVRTVQMLINTQLRRGRKMRVYLTSGLKPKEIERKAQIILAAIEDSTSWKCDKCSAPNLKEAKVCVICETKRKKSTKKSKKNK